MASATIENKALKDQVNNLEKQSSDIKKDIQQKNRKAEYSEDQLREALNKSVNSDIDIFVNNFLIFLW